MSPPLLSIITVCKDDLAGVQATWDSLRRQTWRGFDWIVQDGGSTNMTAAWVSGRHDPAARWVSAPDAGIYDAMNRAQTRASGTWLLFLNAGDRLAAPDTLQRLVPEMGEPADLILAASLHGVDGHLELRPVRGTTPEDLRRPLRGMPTSHQAMLFRRAAVATQLYRTDLRIAADYALYVNVAARARRIVVVDTPLCRLRPGGLSEREAALGRREQAAVRRSLLQCPPWRDRTIRLQQGLAQILRRRLPGLYRRLRCSQIVTDGLEHPVVEPARLGEMGPGATVQDAETHQRAP